MQAQTKRYFLWAGQTVLFMGSGWIFYLMSAVLNHTLHAYMERSVITKVIGIVMGIDQLYLFVCGIIGCLIVNRNYVKWKLNSLKQVGWYYKKIGIHLLVAIMLYEISLIPPVYQIIYSSFSALGSVLHLQGGIYENLIYIMPLDYWNVMIISTMGIGYILAKLFFDQRVVEPSICKELNEPIKIKLQFTEKRKVYFHWVMETLLFFLMGWVSIVLTCALLRVQYYYTGTGLAAMTNLVMIRNLIYLFFCGVVVCLFINRRHVRLQLNSLKEIGWYYKKVATQIAVGLSVVGIAMIPVVYQFIYSYAYALGDLLHLEGTIMEDMVHVIPFDVHMIMYIWVIGIGYILAKIFFDQYVMEASIHDGLDEPIKIKLKL